MLAEYHCRKDDTDLTPVVRATLLEMGRDINVMVAGTDDKPVHIAVTCPTDDVANLFFVHGSDDGTVLGEALTPEDKTLQDASAKLVTDQETRGLAATQALVGQIVVIGTFLGAFSLLNDSTKAAVVQSDYALGALILGAVSLGFSLSTYVLLPGTLPPLGRIDDVRRYWNARVTWRKYLLTTAFGALAFAIFFALKAFDDGSTAAKPRPAAALTGKITFGTTTSSLEATASWTSLDVGTDTITCVKGLDGTTIIGAAVGAAGADGKETTTLTVPITNPIAGSSAKAVTITSTRLTGPTDDPTSTCTTGSLREGQLAIATIMFP